MFYESEIEYNSNFDDEFNSLIFIDESSTDFQVLDKEVEDGISFKSRDINLGITKWEKLKNEEINKFSKLPFVKFNKKLKSLFSLDITLENTFFECIKEINESSGAFAIDIQSLKIEMENEFDNPDNEIVIKVQVPSESKNDIVNKFWNCIGIRINNVIEELKITDTEKADDLYEKIFILVDY